MERGFGFAISGWFLAQLNMGFGTFLFLWKYKRSSTAAMTALQIEVDRIVDGVEPDQSFLDKMGLAPWLPCRFMQKVSQTRKAENWLQKLFVPDSSANDFLRSLAMFFASQAVGVIVFMVLSMHFAKTIPFIGCMVGILTAALFIAMLVSDACRWVALLAIPGLTTSRLRRLLLMFIFLWAIQGPAANIEMNARVVVESVECVHRRVNKVIDSLDKSKVAESFGRRMGQGGIMDKLNAKVRNMKGLVSAQYRSILKLKQMVSNVKSFLSFSKISCTAMLDAEFQKCITRHKLTFAFGIKDNCTKRSMSSNGGDYQPIFSEIEQIIQLFQCGLCTYIRDMKVLCKFPSAAIDALNDNVFGPIGSVVKDTLREIGREFEFNVTYHKEESKNTTIDHDLSSLAAKLRDGIRPYKLFLKFIAECLKWFMIPYAFVFPYLTAFVYRRHWRAHETYDNYYITSEVTALNDRRGRMKKPTIMPLMPKEKELYAESAFALSMMSREKKKLAWCLVLTVLSLLLPVAYIIADWQIYHFALEINSFFANRTDSQVPDFYAISIEGDGMVSSIYKQLLDKLVPADNAVDSLDQWRVCFHDPNPPDFAFAKLIAWISALCVILCWIEVYVFRLRPVVCAKFQPAQERVRALYMYNNVLLARKLIFAVASKDLPKGVATANLDVVSRLLPLMHDERQICVQCGVAGKRTDTDNFKSCLFPNCSAPYCTECYQMRKKCRNCGLTLSAGRGTDIEEEKDSSMSESGDNDSDADVTADDGLEPASSAPISSAPSGAPGTMKKVNKMKPKTTDKTPKTANEEEESEEKTAEDE